MKYIFTLLILSLLINQLHSQITFQKTYGGSGPQDNCYVTTTYDGGYALAGSTGSFGAGDYDVYVVRTDSMGNILWTKTYGGALADMAKDIKQTSDSGFIITGATESFGGGRGYPGLYLIRTDKNGDTLWTRAYGDGRGETGVSVEQTTDGGFIAVGDWQNTGYLYIVRTKSNGDTLWTTINDGGYGYGVVENADKGFTMGGTTYINPAANDMFMCRTDSAGNVMWYQTYGGTNTEGGYALTKGNDGGFVMVGFAASFVLPVTNGAYVVKTDSAGNVIWSKVYEGLSGVQGWSVASTGDGYVVLANEIYNEGYTTQALLIKIDNYGNLMWARNYSDIYVGKVVQTADGGFALSGYPFLSSNPNPPFYLIKTDAAGNSGCTDSAATIVVDTAATIVLTMALTPMSGTIVGSTATVVSNGGEATVICVSTGLENIAAGRSSSITVFPNPAFDEITVTIDPDFVQVKSIDFYNMLGQQVMTSKRTTEINIAPLPAGVYLLKITNATGITNTARFQKL